MKKLNYIFALLVIGFTACTDPYANDTSLIKDVNALPAASYLEKTDSLNASMWVEMLKYTDLYNTLNLAANYTCFVPSNSAVQSYLSSNGLQKVTDISKEMAITLIKYHTIKGAAYSAVSFEDGVMPDTTATGDFLSTSFNENGGAVQINLEATIQKTVKTNNAYIHIVNKVLTPVTQTVWEKLQNGKFNILSQAIEAVGYKDKLNTVNEIINTKNYKYRFTLFAVSDSVYNSIGISSFQQLKDSLRAGTDYTASDNALNKYVFYHLLNQQISYSTLSYFTQTDTKRSKNYSTMAANELMNVSEVSKELYINYNTTTKKGIKFLQINRNCKNGVMHIIDGLMPVIIPKPTTFQWEFTDYPILASTLSKYRTAGLTSNFTAVLDPKIISSYNWLPVPASRAGLYYVIANKNDAQFYKALNYDYLRLDLGIYGWVEMTTPAIMAGTYKLTVEHYNPLATEGQGKIWFIIDGAYFGAQVSTRGASKTASNFTKSPIGTGTITFSTTKTHTVRILAADSYTSDLDCLTFTPQ